MSGTIQTEDVVRYVSGVYQYPIELGELANARSALQRSKADKSAEATSTVRLKLILDGWGRLAVAWEDTDVDHVPFVRHGTIDIFAENGETVFHAEVKMQSFPPSQFGVLFGTPGRSTRSNHQHYRVALAFATSASLRRVIDASENATVSSKVLTAFTYEQSPQDVCFVFPATDTKLWASSKILIDQSAYYRTLLDGEFAESATRTSPEESNTPESKAGATCRLYDESDDETDEHFAGEIVKGARKTVGSLPYKKVVINDAAFTTYQATLVWMSSRYIRFAPLRSRMDNNGSDETESRLQDIIKMVEASPETSMPASPKSVYRLAHLLELKDLQEVALANLSSQLTSRNAAIELFGDVASAYPALRDVVLNFVVKNWPGVLASEAWKRIKEQADGHMLPAGAAHTALLLLESTR